MKKELSNIALYTARAFFIGIFIVVAAVAITEVFYKGGIATYATILVVGRLADYLYSFVGKNDD